MEKERMTREGKEQKSPRKYWHTKIARRGFKVKQNAAGLYRAAVEAVKEIQQRHKKRLTVDSARKSAEKIIRKMGLEKDPRRQYFYVFAVCALINKEPMCRYWKKRGKKK